MKKRISLFMITFMAAVCFSLSGVFAASYSKTKTKTVSYGSQCTANLNDKATVTSSLSWSFSPSGSTKSSQNGYRFGSAYSNGVSYANSKKTATNTVGYYFYNSLGNNVGGSSTTFSFNFSGISIS